MKTRLIPIAVLTCLLASCTRGADIPDGTETDNSLVPLIITASGIQTGTAVTRSYQLLGEGSIGVFLENASGVTAYAKKDNVKYDYGIPWMVANADQTLFLIGPYADVCAYYPYDAAITDKTSVDLLARILKDGEAPLAYVTNQGMNKKNNKRSFNMDQASAWLVINFIRGDIHDGCTLSEFALVNDGLYTGRNINISTGAENSNTPAADGRITFTGDIPLAKNSTATRNLQMPPAPSLAGGLAIEVKIKEYGGLLLRKTLTEITSLARKGKYTLNLTVNTTGLEVTSVVVNWSPSISTGNGTTIDGQPYYDFSDPVF